VYEQVFNYLGLREDPFHVSPDPRFFYYTPAHETALTGLLFGVETRQGLMVLTGEPGTGKTSVLKQILDWLHKSGRSSSFVFHTRVEPIGLLRLMLSDFGVPCHSKSKSELVRSLHHWLLQQHAVGDLPVLVLDEAQALPPQTLDEIRLLLNLETPRGKLLQVILSGQPELEEKLRLPGLRQLRQRIMFHAKLPVLTKEETGEYISSRLAVAGCADPSLFSEDVVQSIYANSHGIPRVVNLLCEHALINAYGEQRRVISPENIQRIAVDFDLCPAPMEANDWELPRPYGVMEPAAIMAEIAAGPGWAPALPAMKIPRPYPRVAEFSSDEMEEVAIGLDTAPASTPPAVTFRSMREMEPVPIASAIPDDAPELETFVAAPVEVRSAPPHRYWKKSGSSAPIAMFARKSASYIQDGWNNFLGFLMEYYGKARMELLRWREEDKLPRLSRRQAIANWWSQIDFDVYKDVMPSHTSAEQVDVVVEEESLDSAVPMVVAAQSVKPEKQWRNHRTRLRVEAMASKYAKIIGSTWHSASDAIVEYGREVVDSFVRDCRNMFRTPTLSTTTSGMAAPTEREDEKFPTRRNAGAVVQWLRQPMSPRMSASNRPTARVAATRGRAKAARAR
jgi:general secretion pathway protein A